MRTPWVAVLLLAGSVMPALCAGYDDLNAGIAARNRADWQNAIYYFDKALAAGDLIPDQQYVAHLDRGAAHAVRGELEAAIADLTACLEERPGDRTALYGRAEVYLRNRKGDAAIKDMDALLAGNPDDISAHLIRADAYETAGNGAKELEDLLAAKAKLPDSNKRALNFRTGVAQFLAGNVTEADALLSDARDTKGYVWLWRAMTHLRQGGITPADRSNSPKGTDWTNLLIQYFRGDITEEKLRAAAGEGSVMEQKGKVCEADFYLGEWRRLHGDVAGGKPLIQKAADFCPAGYIESYAAQSEVKNVP